MTESEPITNEICQWQKERMNYFLKGLSKIFMIPLISFKSDMAVFECVQASKLFGCHLYVEKKILN